MNGKRRVAFITGIGRGQGRHHAIRLAEDGFDIVGIDICSPIPTIHYPATTLEDLDETIALVQKVDGRIIAQQCDTRDIDGLRRVVGEGIAEFGSLDVVVANAAVSAGGKLWEFTDEQWDTMIAINLKGTWNTIRATIPPMIEQNTGGSVIIVGSHSSLVGIPYAGHYNAAKHGVLGLCRTLANEVGIYGIRVNGIHPGHIDTPLAGPGNEYMDILADPAVAEHIGPQFIQALLPQTAMHPSATSDVVSFLASENSKNMTGVQIPVDRGVTVR